jgi:hypothetical protein
MRPDTRDAGYLEDMRQFSREAIAIVAENSEMLEIVETRLPSLIRQRADLIPSEL